MSKKEHKKARKKSFLRSYGKLKYTSSVATVLLFLIYLITKNPETFYISMAFLFLALIQFTMYFIAKKRERR